MKVGLVGAGIIGRAMGEALLRAGHELRVYNRTEERARPLLELGAVWAPTPADAAAGAGVVISAVRDPAAVDAVVFGPDGILGALGAEAAHCDMGTVTPESAQRVQEAYRAAARVFVQAPILGSKRQIAEGSLLVFAGGTENEIARCEPAWSAFTGRIWRFGSAREAAAAKLACNMLIAHMILGLGQSMAFVEKQGLDPAVLLEILNASAMGCAMFTNKGKTLLAGDYRPNFVVSNMLKDLTLASESARSAGIEAPFVELALSLFEQAEASGFGAEDYSAVTRLLRSGSGQPAQR